MSIASDKYAQIYRFKVVIDQLEVGEFREVDGLTVQREVIEYHEGGLNSGFHKLVGPTRWSNIVLKRGVFDSTVLYDWQKELIDGTIGTKEGSIMALKRNGETLIRWDFTKGWPCRYEGPDFRAGVSELAVELLEIAHQGFTMKKS